MPKSNAEKLAEVHSRALSGFDDTVSVLQDERAEMLEDRRFVSIAGAQWEGEWADQFENSIRVEVNKTALGLEKIVNDYRSNRVTVNFRAVGDKSSEDTAKMLDGLFRADAYRSKAQQAFDNAFEEAAAGGFGAWRLTNEYEDEYDPENDHQRIAFKAIVDADQSVFFDLNSKLLDKSDARHAWVVTAMTKDAFEKEYPDKLASWPEGLTKPFYDWFAPTVIRVAEYYEVEDVTETLKIFVNPIVNEEDRRFASDLDDGEEAELIAQGWRLDRTRPCKRRRVHKYIMSGAEVLDDKGYIAGDCIPIIPVYGKRWFIDNVERVRGHVRLSKDPQRIYNAQISKLTETASTAPIERPIFTPEQVAGHEQSWAEANLNRAPYALINQITDENGNVVASGPIGTVSPPQMQPVMAALIQITANDIAELTNSDDGADQVKANISAEAMDIAATRVDAKSYTYMDNFRQSMQRCGEVYQSMACDIYVEEGRTVDLLGDDGEESQATLVEGFTDERGRYSVRHDLSKGKYKVISDVTEATATRRDKTVKTCLNGAQIVAAFDPELAGALVSTAYMNVDGEGIEDLQAWLRQRSIRSGLVKPNDEEAQQLQQEVANQQPDPQSQALQAQAEALAAQAGKEQALTQKAAADTDLARAKTVETLANAHKLQAETGKTHQEARQVGMEPMRPKIRTGRELEPQAA